MSNQTVRFHWQKVTVNELIITIILHKIGHDEHEVKDKPQNKLLYVGAIAIVVMLVFGIKGMTQGPKHETDASVVSLDFDGDETKLFDDRGKTVAMNIYIYIYLI